MVGRKGKRNAKKRNRQQTIARRQDALVAPMGRPFPPQMRLRPVMSMVFRFSNAATVTSQGITRRDILWRLIAVATETSSVQCTPLFYSARLRAIEIWNFNTTTTSLIDVAWMGATNSYTPGLEYMDSGNATRPAHVLCVPPRNSLADFWTNIGGSTLTEELFQFRSCSAECRIDVHMDFMLADAGEDTNEASTEGTLAGAVASGVYCTPLDIESTAISPLGWTSSGIVSSIPGCCPRRPKSCVSPTIVGPVKNGAGARLPLN